MFNEHDSLTFRYKITLGGFDMPLKSINQSIEFIWRYIVT